MAPSHCTTATARGSLLLVPARRKRLPAFSHKGQETICAEFETWAFCVPRAWAAVCFVDRRETAQARVARKRRIVDDDDGDEWHAAEGDAEGDAEAEEGVEAEEEMVEEEAEDMEEAEAEEAEAEEEEVEEEEVAEETTEE
eukprot:6188953-Pleurochrysis_carterae.AAC.4